MTRSPAARRPLALALLFVLGGAVGWYASFELAVAKFAVLTDPTTDTGCNFSLIVQCGKNLDSWQGAVFGFPNPLLGVAGFIVPIVVGVAMLAGARFARWFWIAFTAGIATAFAFVVWLMSQSIFALGTLCPWCMVVWAVVIPLFWAVVLDALSSGTVPLPQRSRAFFRAATGWVPLLTIASYAVVAVIAQLRLDVLSYL